MPLPQVDMRYTGQEYTITVDAPDDGTDVEALIERFHGDYLVRYGHSTPGAPVETVAVRMTASGANDWPMAAGAPDHAAARARPTRSAVFGGGPSTRRSCTDKDIGEDTTVDGPAIVEEPTSTTVVPPGWRVALGPANALVMSRSEGVAA